MIDERQTICQSEKLASIFINKARIRNIFLTLDSRANRLHDGFQGFHAADKRTGSCYSGLVHHELAPGNSGYQAVANRLDIARGQRAFHSDRLETPRIYTPATRNGSLDVNHQCIRPFGNVQLAVSCRNAVFVSRANSAVLFHAGCYGLSRLKLHRIGSDASDNAKPRSEPCRANSTLNPERRF